MATKQAAKKASAKDWHSADIKAALAKAGWSMRQLGIENSVTGETIRRALRTPYPKSERIIADAIGVDPTVIWPSRYNADGSSNRPRGRTPMRPDNVKQFHAPQPTTRTRNSNTQTEKAA